MTAKAKRPKIVLTLTFDDPELERAFRKACEDETRSMAMQVEHLIKKWLASR